MMKEWESKDRNRTLLEAREGELEKLREQTKSSPWRQFYHIQPPHGLLNDPNGFCQKEDGSWRLFYQWFPYGPVHGLKHWYEVCSPDLVHWENKGCALIPDTYFDGSGCYSGSGFFKGKEFRIFYTGNHRDSCGNRKSYQIIAREQKDKFIKEKPAVSKSPALSTEHFRDPFVWKEEEVYKAVIGSHLKNGRGAAFIYESRDGSKWEEKEYFDFEDFGYMWECPNIAFFEEKAVMIFCPQGLKNFPYDNIYPAGYVTGDTIFSFQKESFRLLDYGFDFYAPQIALDREGKYIMIAWMGLPEIIYPDNKDNWAHCLTIPREIFYREGKLYQKPAAALETLRRGKKVYSVKGKEWIRNNGIEAHEIIFYPKGDFSIQLFYNHKEQRSFKISYSKEIGKLTISRKDMTNIFGKEYGMQREIALKNCAVLRVFTDKSSVEIFTEEGDSLSSRVFPAEKEKDLCIEGEGELFLFSLKEISGIQ